MLLSFIHSFIPTFSTSLGLVFSASQRTTSRGAATAGLSPVTSGVVSIAIKQLNDKPNSSNCNNNSNRPLQRLGFAGKKSTRAEVRKFSLNYIYSFIPTYHVHRSTLVQLKIILRIKISMKN